MKASKMRSLKWGREVSNALLRMISVCGQSAKKPSGKEKKG